MRRHWRGRGDVWAQPGNRLRKSRFPCAWARRRAAPFPGAQSRDARHARALGSPNGRGPANNNVMRENEYAAPFEGCDGFRLRLPPPASISRLLRADSERRGCSFRAGLLRFVLFMLRSSPILDKIGSERTATYHSLLDRGQTGSCRVLSKLRQLYLATLGRGGNAPR